MVFPDQTVEAVERAAVAEPHPPADRAGPQALAGQVVRPVSQMQVAMAARRTDLEGLAAAAAAPVDLAAAPAAETMMVQAAVVVVRVSEIA